MNEVFVPETFFMSLPPKEDLPAFELLWSKDRRAVGVIDRRDPDVVLLIYDMSTHESWPYRNDHEEGAENRAKGTKLLRLLEPSENGRGPLMLAS